MHQQHLVPRPPPPLWRVDRGGVLRFLAAVDAPRSWSECTASTVAVSRHRALAMARASPRSLVMSPC
mgnify:CR=1 FL=1